jgi:hypothetical protein
MGQPAPSGVTGRELVQVGADDPLATCSRVAHLKPYDHNLARRAALVRVRVYRAASVLAQKTGEAVTPAFMGTREALKLISLKPVEDSGIEVDESEWDRNWLYYPNHKP